MLAFKNYSPDDLSIDGLSPLLKARFLRGRLTLTQVRAFSTFLNPQAQDTLFKQLGPLANDPGILGAIQRGDTVLPLEDDFLILPTRARRGLPTYPADM